MGDIYLRVMEDSDTDLIVAWRNCDRVRHNFIYQELFTAQGHRNWIRTQIVPGHVVQFVICEKENDRAVGSVYFRDIDYDNRCAEYGIFIGEDDAVGKGYGTKAAKLALAYAFDTLQLREVFLRVFADNVSARKSYENAGFQLIPDRQDVAETMSGSRKVIFMRCTKEMAKQDREAEQ